MQELQVGSNGLITKSLAPALKASVTIDCWPMAVTMATLASGSMFLISLRAVKPSMSGMVMSNNTMSGRNSLYTSTAWVPVLASKTSYPLWVSSFLQRIRMNAASSTTMIVGISLSPIALQNLFRRW